MKRLMLTLSLLVMMAVSAEAQYHRPSGRYHRPMRNYSATRVRTPRAPRDLGFERNTLKLHIMGEVGLTDVGSVFYHRGISHFGAGMMLEYQPAHIFSIGVGANFNAGSNRQRPYFDNFMYSVPIYANFRLSTPGYVRFFVEGRIGGALPLYITQNDYIAQGLYTGGGMGLSVGGSNISVGANVTDLYPNGYDAPRHFGYHGDVLVEFYLRYSYAFRLR